MINRQANNHNILFHIIGATIVGVIVYLILSISLTLDFKIVYDTSIFFITTAILAAIIVFALLEK